jgi:hypothetical protein
MIERLCKTFEEHHGYCWPRSPTDLRDWRPSRAALEAEVERLTKESNEARANYQFMVDRACDQKLDGYRGLGARAAAAENERHAAVREAEGLRAEVARLESDRAGLRYSLTEVEDELEECRKERDEARARVAGLMSDLEAEAGLARVAAASMVAAQFRPSLCGRLVCAHESQEWQREHCSGLVENLLPPPPPLPARSRLTRCSRGCCTENAPRAPTQPAPDPTAKSSASSSSARRS